MLRVFGVVWIAFLFSSCNRADDEPSGALNGTYSGTFHETSVIKDSAFVTIVFVGSTFSGASIGSDRSICNGTYQIFGDSINFKNLCNISDADLLLVGTYQLISKGDSLYFTRDFGDLVHFKDVFSLKKE